MCPDHPPSPPAVSPLPSPAILDRPFPPPTHRHRKVSEPRNERGSGGDTEEEDASKPVKKYHSSGVVPSPKHVPLPQQL